MPRIQRGLRAVLLPRNDNRASDNHIRSIANGKIAGVREGETGMPVTLFTIHGINTDGKWQEDFEEIFAPHYDYVRVKYENHEALFGIPQVLFGLGLKKAANTFLRIYDKYDNTPNYRRYVIAHSYGTVLSVYTMQKFPNVAFDRLIFLGSPLSSQLNWYSTTLEAKEFDLINEFGSKDRIVRMAKYIFWRKMLGDAGRSGFKGPNTHTVDQPLSKCKTCRHSRRTKVHNIRLPLFEHSDYFLSLGYARTLWLPRLWGYTPSRYKAFLDLCKEAYDYECHQNWEDLKLVEAKLRCLELDLGPNGGMQSIGQHIKRQLNGEEDLLTIGADSLVPLIIWGVWQEVIAALEHPGDRNKAKSLYPPTAVRRAIDACKQTLERIRHTRQSSPED